MSEVINRHDALNFDTEITTDPDEIKGIIHGMTLYAEYIKKLPYIECPEAHGSWISVEKKLPDETMKVLAIGVKGGVKVCKFFKYTGGFYDHRSDRCRITHWMELPKPPKR